MARHELLVDAFVELAETLVINFDLVDFLHELTARCGMLLDADAVGLLLADDRGRLQLMAASSEQPPLLEFFQGNADDGPGLVAFETGEPAGCPDLTIDDQGWPGFSDQVHDAGFRAVYAVPMRVHAEVVGVVNLFFYSPTDLPPADGRIVRALVDVATVGLVQQRAIRHQWVLAEQLKAAYNDRVLVNQAKGVLAERLHIGMDEAFAVMRHRANVSGRRLTDLALHITIATDEPLEIN